MMMMSLLTAAINQGPIDNAKHIRKIGVPFYQVQLPPLTKERILFTGWWCYKEKFKNYYIKIIRTISSLMFLKNNVSSKPNDSTKTI